MLLKSFKKFVDITFQSDYFTISYNLNVRINFHWITAVYHFVTIFAKYFKLLQVEMQNPTFVIFCSACVTVVTEINWRPTNETQKN